MPTSTSVLPATILSTRDVASAENWLVPLVATVDLAVMADPTVELATVG